MSIKLLLIGTARQPTLNVGSNGLGRHTYDFLNQFQQKKDLNITTLLHKDSKLEWSSIRQLSYNNEISELFHIKEFIIKEKHINNSFFIIIVIIFIQIIFLLYISIYHPF